MSKKQVVVTAKIPIASLTRLIDTAELYLSLCTSGEPTKEPALTVIDRAIKTGRLAVHKAKLRKGIFT